MSAKRESQEPLDKFIPGNEVFSEFNSIDARPNAPLRILVLSNNYSIPFNRVSEEINGDELSTKIAFESEELILWELDFKNKFNERLIKCPHCNKKFSFDDYSEVKNKTFLLEYKSLKILVLVSNYNRHNYEFLLESINKFYPVISRVFYRAYDLRFILNVISDRKKVEVIGKSCVAKRLFADKKTIVTYEDDTLEGFFKRAREENSWIDSIEVLIPALGILRFSRKGVIQYSKPFNFKAFFDIVIDVIIHDLLIGRRKQFADRSRHINDLKPKPIILHFETDYFSSRDNIVKLIDRLNKSKSYETAIIYLADGLAHIQVYDYLNGCGFDIYINSYNELNIVPQTQVTSFGLEALIIRINDLFEGNIK